MKTAMAIMLLLAGSANAGTPAQDFRKYVAEAAAKAGNVKEYAVYFVPRGAYGPAENNAWVSACFPGGTICKAEVNIWRDVLQRGNRAELQYIAYHEVCHLSYGDNIFWVNWTPERRDLAHEEVRFCMITLLGKARFEYLRRQANR